MTERVKIEVEIEVDVAHLAQQFAGLTDDAQAQFLCLAAKSLGDAADGQAFFIGAHLRTCDCSTDEGRAFIRAIVGAMDFEQSEAA